MDHDKPAHKNSHESSGSDPPAKPPNKKRRDKHGKKKHAAEGSDDEHPNREETAEGVAGRDAAADFGDACEWPVDTKTDSAGPPVRKEPEAGKVEKKESKKKEKKPKIKDHHEEKKQSPTSDNNHKDSEKATEKAVTEECTTKRNLYLIKTERTRKSEEDRTSEEKEDEREKKKRKKKKRSKKNEKKKISNGEKRGSGEKIEDKKKNTSPNKRKVDLSSIHVDKEKPLLPKVDRGPIKPEGWHDVERDQLYNIIPQYANLPEDTLMKQLRPPPENTNTNPFSPRCNAPLPQMAPRASSRTEPNETTKKAVTDREKNQSSVGPAEGSEVVSEMQSKTIDFKKAVKRRPLWAIIVFGVMTGLILACIVLIGLVVAFVVVTKGYSREVAELRKQVAELNATVSHRD